MFLGIFFYCFCKRQDRGGWCGCCASRPRGRLGKGDVFRARHESVFYFVFWRYISGCCCRGYQAHTHVYYQTSSLSTRGNLAHTLSIVFNPNHNKPSGPLPLPLSISDLVALGCLSPLRESGDMNQIGTVGNQRVIAGLSMDENSRIDENEQTMSRSVRPTQPSASALLVSVCICVPRATRSSTPTSFQNALSAQPPGSWVPPGSLG